MRRGLPSGLARTRCTSSSPWSLLDWRLAAFSLVLLPFFVLAHPPRRRGSAGGSPPSARGSMADSLLPGRGSRCRSSGMLPRQVSMGRSDGPRPCASPRRVRRRLADLEVRSRMAGPLADVRRPHHLRRDARPRLLVRRPDPAVRRPGDHPGHAGRLHHAPDTASSSRSASSCRVRRRQIQTSLALFDRIFEYLDLPVDIAEAARRRCARRAARRGAPGRRRLPLRRRRAVDLDGIDLVVPAGTQTRRRRRDRLGQDHARLPGRPPVRRRAR